MNDWFEAEKRVERAQQLSESYRFVEALAELEVALSINPNNATWHAQRGFLLDELDKPAEAIKAYRQSLDLDPDDRDVMLALGTALMGIGRYAKAIEVLDNLSNTYPDFEPAYCHRIAAYAELGRHDQAEELFYLAQELDDACPHCFFHIGGSLAARGESARALFCWKRVLDLDPGYIGVNRRIGQAYRAQGKLDEAKEYLLCEFREDPGNVEILFDLADLAWEAGDLATAAAKFAQIIELEPGHLEARYSLGRLQLRAGKPKAALACFEALLRTPEAAERFSKIDVAHGEALYQLGRYTEAGQVLGKAAKADTNDVNAVMMAGNCMLAQEKIQQAAEFFRQVLALDHDHAFAHHNLGVCLMQLDHVEAGLRHCQQAVQAKPKFVPAMYNAALGHVQLGQWKLAKQTLIQASKIEPANKLVAQLIKNLWRYWLRYQWRRTRRVLSLGLAR